MVWELWAPQSPPCWALGAGVRRQGVTVPPLGGRDQVWRQVGRQLVALQLDFDEVVGQANSLVVQEPVPVHVSQLPDLSQHRVGELGLYHLLSWHWHP